MPTLIFDKKQQYYGENSGVYGLILLLNVKKAEDDNVVTRLAVDCYRLTRFQLIFAVFRQWDK